MTAHRRTALIAAALALAAGTAAAQQPPQPRPVTPQTGVEAEVGRPGAVPGAAAVRPSSPLTAAEARTVQEHIADAGRHIQADRMRDALRVIERAQTALLNSRYATRDARAAGGPAYADLEAALGAVDDRQARQALAAMERASSAIQERPVSPVE